MEYKKVKARFEIRDEEGKVVATETRDYLQFRRFVDETSQAQVIYRAPDTPAGIASLNRRNPDHKPEEP